MSENKIEKKSSFAMSASAGYKVGIPTSVSEGRSGPTFDIDLGLVTEDQRKDLVRLSLDIMPFGKKNTGFTDNNTFTNATNFTIGTSTSSLILANPVRLRSSSSSVFGITNITSGVNPSTVNGKQFDGMLSSELGWSVTKDYKIGVEFPIGKNLLLSLNTALTLGVMGNGLLIAPLFGLSIGYQGHLDQNQQNSSELGPCEISQYIYNKVHSLVYSLRMNGILSDPYQTVFDAMAERGGLEGGGGGRENDLAILRTIASFASLMSSNPAVVHSLGTNNSTAPWLLLGGELAYSLLLGFLSGGNAGRVDAIAGFSSSMGIILANAVSETLSPADRSKLKTEELQHRIALNSSVLQTLYLITSAIGIFAKVPQVLQVGVQAGAAHAANPFPISNPKAEKVTEPPVFLLRYSARNSEKGFEHGFGIGKRYWINNSVFGLETGVLLFAGEQQPIASIYSQFRIRLPKDTPFQVHLGAEHGYNLSGNDLGWFAALLSLALKVGPIHANAEFAGGGKLNKTTGLQPTYRIGGGMGVQF